MTGLVPLITDHARSAALDFHSKAGELNAQINGAAAVRHGPSAVVSVALHLLHSIIAHYQPCIP
jgi:hypothetical protein